MLTNSQHHHIEKLFHLRSKLGHLYWHLILQAFGLSLISIFIPIYLLTIGFSLTKIFIFLLVEWSIFGFFSPLYGKIIHKVGLKEVIIIRTPIFILSLGLLSLLKTSIFLQQYVYLIAILIGFSGGLYTLSLTSLFAKYMGKKKLSEKTSKFIALPRIVSIGGPLIGGIIAASLGFAPLFIIVIFLLIISLIPILSIKKNIDHPPFSLHVLKKIKTYPKEFLILSNYGIKGLVFSIILPIAIYLQSQSIISLGLIVSIIVLFSAIFTIYIGKLADKYKSRKIIKVGAFSGAILSLAFAFILHSTLLLYLSLLAGFVNVLISIPYETFLYKRSKESKSPLEFLAYKEFSLFIGRAIFFLLLIFLSQPLISGFYIGSISSILFLFF